VAAYQYLEGGNLQDDDAGSGAGIEEYACVMKPCLVSVVGGDLLCDGGNLSLSLSDCHLENHGAEEHYIGIVNSVVEEIDVDVIQFHPYCGSPDEIQPFERKWGWEE
jgi:hypothetical protein